MDKSTANMETSVLQFFLLILYFQISTKNWCHVNLNQALVQIDFDMKDYQYQCFTPFIFFCPSVSRLVQTLNTCVYSSHKEGIAVNSIERMSCLLAELAKLHLVFYPYDNKNLRAMSQQRLRLSPFFCLRLGRPSSICTVPQGPYKD